MSASRSPERGNRFRDDDMQKTGAESASPGSDNMRRAFGRTFARFIASMDFSPEGMKAN
jgi:hypothetical protein